MPRCRREIVAGPGCSNQASRPRGSETVPSESRGRVAAREHVRVAVAIDVGDGETHELVGHGVSDCVEPPGVLGPLGLLQPHQVAEVASTMSSRPSPFRSAKSTLNPVTRARSVSSSPGGRSAAGIEVPSISRCSRKRMSPSVTFSNQKTRLSATEPPSTSRSPSPSSHRLRVDRPDPREFVLHPARGVEGVAAQFEPRGWGSAAFGPGFCAPLLAVTISGRPSWSKSAREHADEGPASRDHRRDQSCPRRGARIRTRILQVYEVAELARRDHVGPAVTVQVPDARPRPRPRPARRGWRAPTGRGREPNVTRPRRRTRCPRGPDVEVSVAVEIPHDGAVGMATPPTPRRRSGARATRCGRRRRRWPRWGIDAASAAGVGSAGSQATSRQMATRHMGPSTTPSSSPRAPASSP